jgi:hypothetical protein
MKARGMEMAKICGDGVVKTIAAKISSKTMFPTL